MLRTLAARLFVPLFFAGLAAAQEIKVPDGPLQVGTTIEIAVNDPSRANGSIVVTIANDDPADPQKVEVVIKLDASGSGTGSWQVGDWFTATFNAPGCKEVSRLVEEAKPVTAAAR